jgi:hypothetical protein
MNTAIVKANPVLMTLIFGILSFAGIFSVEPEDPLSYRIFAVGIAVIVLSVLLVWLNAIADVASRSGASEVRAPKAYVYFLALMSFAVSVFYHTSSEVLTLAQTIGKASGSVCFALMAFCIWRVAQSVEYADRRQGVVSVGTILGTAALLFFSILGVWVLRPRLLRLASAQTV